MTLPNTQKELQALCKANSIKFKGKTKAEMIEALNKNEVTDDATEKDVTTEKTVKELRELCCKAGLSRLGSKQELLRRLEVLENNPGGRDVVRWNDRGRKVATRPSETVGLDDSDDESSGEDDNKYTKMKKDELKRQCLDRNLPTAGTVKALVKRLQENDMVREQVASASNQISPEIECESCKQNPQKLYSIPPSKWYCHDCSEHICNLCKEAHEKLKVTRTHIITPYGSLLECNIEKDLTITVNDAIVVAPAPSSTLHFLDFTVTDDETFDINNSGRKRKRIEEDDEIEEVSDANNSYEVVYETPMAKIRYRSNKRLIVDMIPKTPLASSTGSHLSNILENENDETVPETPFVTPPPSLISPARRVVPIIGTVSPLDQTKEHPINLHATFVAESPDMFDISRDMFEESPTAIPETPVAPPLPPPQPVGLVRNNFIATQQPITPVRLQGQRWRNWALTRLAHLPANEEYTDEEVAQNLGGENLDEVEHLHILNIPALEIADVPGEPATVEPVRSTEKEPKKVVTAKPVKESKRKLAYEVPETEKAKCSEGKWTRNHQGGEVYCIDGFSYLLNNHCVSKKTGALTLYLICSKCGSRNILTDGKIKKPAHPSHTCDPDPDNWHILEADNRLKSIGE